MKPKTQKNTLANSVEKKVEKKVRKKSNVVKKTVSRKHAKLNNNKTKVNISVSIVGHNEEHHLQELLPTLSWAREVIYVDCESKDKSVAVARAYGCRVFSRKNNPNLNVNKQFGISQAKSDWIFYLDPDERLTEEGVSELSELVNNQHGYNAFKIKRKNYVLGRFLRYGGEYPDTQLRFFKNGEAHFPQQHIHEMLTVEGQTGLLKHSMIHCAYLDFNQIILKLHRYSSFEADYISKKGLKPHWGNAILYIVLKPSQFFISKYFLKRGFLNGYPGLIFVFMGALHFPVRFFKLWEKCKNKKIKSATH